MKNLLPVYYGWAKLSKVIKREAIVVMFLNDSPGPRIGADGMDGVTRFMDVCYTRYQTDAEKADAQNAIRLYTRYDVFLDKHHGSLQEALQANSIADKNNVSEAERKRIEKALYSHYMKNHPKYKEPGCQLELHI